MSDDVCFLPAAELARRIRRKDLSARELMQASLAQIERLNPRLNAIVSLYPEQALAQALAADEKQARGEALAPLHGLPVAHKDLFLTRGMRTHLRLAHIQGLHPRSEPADRRPAAGRRSHFRRQDQYAGVRRRLADLQRRIRKNTQPLRPQQDLRRFLRRCGGGSGDRHGAACRRQRHGRFAALSGEFLQCRRLAHLARTRAGLAGEDRLEHARCGGADGAHGGRLRADA